LESLGNFQGAPAYFQVFAQQQQEAMQQIQASQVQLQAAMLQVTTRIDQLEQRVMNEPIKRQNFMATAPESPIYPLYNVGGLLPEDFPNARRDLFDLDQNRVISLLEFYGLQVPHTLNAKRASLRSHLGLR
jgi:hypothetical protein